MRDAGEIAAFHDRCSDLMRELLDGAGGGAGRAAAVPRRRGRDGLAAAADRVGPRRRVAAAHDRVRRPAAVPLPRRARAPLGAVGDLDGRRAGRGACGRQNTARPSRTSSVIARISAAEEEQPPERRRLGPERVAEAAEEPHLEEVDRRVHEDPHHVDEVPVDPGHLDAAVLLRGEVPPEGADRREQQQRQADEDVRAVQAGQPVEDRALGEDRRRQALLRQVDVLVDLDEEEGRAEQQRQQRARPAGARGCRASRPRAPSASSATTTRGSAVLTPATSFGSSKSSTGNHSDPATTLMKK